MDRKGGGILITGGSGFLGRAIARTLIEGGHGEPSRICIYSRGEHAQAQMFEQLGRNPRLRMFVGDVRDSARLYWALRSVDTVIHAAALKRIEVGHYNPTEMVRTNIEGSMNVVAAAIAAGVSRVVLVSSDKAYQPVSPYGISKAMAEAVFLASNNTVGEGGPRFAVCRYGNVAGSTGSVIPVWRERIATEQAIEMRDPDATRFWMTIDQAVDLVLQTAAGEEQLRVPDLPAFRMGDLAEAMGAHAGSYPTHRTTLGRWEKKHETLKEGCSSDTAPRMTVEDLKEALTNV
jgi:UDP-N-acetylglucosamine 4,6-dehydratase